MNTYPDFLVRIHCITYNHAPYIEDAMNGFCMQQTTFPFVATIIDDASTDGEPEVIRRFLDAHFDLSEKGLSRQWETDDAYFIYAQHKENKNCYFAVVLLKYNFYSINKNKEPLIKDWINTKYVAFCEGDDYWIVPHKLQKQVDFLETHPDYGMVYTNHKKYIQEEKAYKNGWTKSSDFIDMLFTNNVCTLTVCMKKSLIHTYSAAFSSVVKERKWKMGDYPLWLYAFAESNVKYFEDIMGVYRVLQNSASHFTSFKKKEIFLCSSFDVRYYFANKYKALSYLRLHAKLKKEQLLKEALWYNANLSLSSTMYVIKHCDNFQDFRLSFMRCTKFGRNVLHCYSKMRQLISI